MDENIAYINIDVQYKQILKHSLFISIYECAQNIKIDTYIHEFI